MDLLVRWGQISGRRRDEERTSPPTVAIALEGAVMGIYLGESLMKD